MSSVKTVVLGPPPAELEALIARRHTLGLDIHDEVWEGVYHVAPAPRPAHGYVDNALAVLLDPYARAAGLLGTGPFNLGSSNDYRVPDRGYHRELPDRVYVPTAAVVVEVVSPDDETYAKLDFYAAHGVEEILVADPAERTISCYALVHGRYEPRAGSHLLAVTAQQLGSKISWPSLDRPTRP